jgi:copper chaperone CopZ
MSMATAEKSVETAKVILSIANPRCSFCSHVIEKKVAKMPGVKDVAMSYLTDKVLIRYDPDKVTTGAIRQSIKKLGYDSIEHH